MTKPLVEPSRDDLLAHRRAWTTLVCLACRNPWPCGPFRAAVPLATPATRAAAVVTMTAEARRVRRESVDIGSATLIGRFLWWLKLNRGDAQMVAGEVWPDASLPPRS